MYCSVVLHQMIIIIITMNSITTTFACLSSNICPCTTISIPSCPCVQQPIPIQQNRYATPFILSNKVSSFYASPSSYFVPYSSYSYSSANIVPYARVPYSQPYNSLYTYNTPQSFPQQSYVPQVVSPASTQLSLYPQVSNNIIPAPEIYNPPGIIPQATSNNFPTSEIYNPPGIIPQTTSNNTPMPEIYNPSGIIPQATSNNTPMPEIYNPPGITPQAISNNLPASEIYNPPGIVPHESLLTNAKATPIYEPRNNPEEYSEHLQQVQVKPSNINSELINNAYQENTEYGGDTTDITLPAQNVALVPITQPSEVVDNLVPYQTEMTTTEIYTNNEFKKRFQFANLAQRHASGARNVMIHSIGNSRKRYQDQLPCFRSAGNYNQVIIPITGREKSIKECITLLNLLASNTDVQKIKMNNIMDGHTLINNEPKVNLNIDNKIGNKSSIRNSIRLLNIHRAESIKKLKSSDGLITDNHTTTMRQGNGDKIIKYDNNRILKSGKINVNSIGIKEYISQRMKPMTGKDIFKKVSSSDWSNRSDKLFARTFGRSNRLNNETKRNEDNYYTTYYHQICTGQILGHLRNGTIMSTSLKCNELDCDATNVRISENRILEIIFLKNVTGRFRNYGSYCISKKPIAQIKSSHVVLGTKKFLRSHRFYNELTRKGISHHKFWEANRLEKQLASFMKPLLIDCKNNKTRCHTNLHEENLIQNKLNK